LCTFYPALPPPAPNIEDKMDDLSKETLQRVKENDPKLTTLYLYGSRSEVNGRFNSDVDGAYSQLGEYILGQNTHIKILDVNSGYDGHIHLDGGPRSSEDDSDHEFYEGLKRNSSIQKLLLNFSYWPGSDIPLQLMKTYQYNNNLTHLHIEDGIDLENGRSTIVIETLRSCQNLISVYLQQCGIGTTGFSRSRGVHLLPFIDAIRHHHHLEELNLDSNTLRHVGCEIIAPLLEDPNTKLQCLILRATCTDREGVKVLLNSLANNRKLERLILDNCVTNWTGNENRIDPNEISPYLFQLLCNTSSLNSIYSSNHTMNDLSLARHWSRNRVSSELESLLKLNKNTNKGHVAIMKILQYHPNVLTDSSDVEPFFADWISDDEQTLKGLPYVVDWFDRAKEAVVASSSKGASSAFDIGKRKLTAIYQFARAMPSMFDSNKW